MYCFRRFISIILCLSMLLLFPLAVQAAEAEPISGDIAEYITFMTGNERIASDGTFEFNVRAELQSEFFTANRNTIKIYSKCKRLNVNTGRTESSESYSYTLTLYERGVGVVDSYTGYANNEKTTKKFSVERGNEYYFIITCNPTHTMPYSLYGSGKVTNITA